MGFKVGPKGHHKNKKKKNNKKVGKPQGRMGLLIGEGIAGLHSSVCGWGRTWLN